jgi:hypothetical protein
LLDGGDINDIVLTCIWRSMESNWYSDRLGYVTPRKCDSIPEREKQRHVPSPRRADYPVSHTMGTADIIRGVKWPERETHYSPPSRAEGKNEWS